MWMAGRVKALVHHMEGAVEILKDQLKIVFPGCPSGNHYIIDPRARFFPEYLTRCRFQASAGQVSIDGATDFA